MAKHKPTKVAAEPEAEVSAAPAKVTAADIKAPVITAGQLLVELKSLMKFLNERKLKALAKKNPAVAALLKQAK